jgi:hypothetical protein
MITQEQYLEAKKIVDAYNKQLDLYIVAKRSELLNAKRGDYLTYIGGSESKYLIKGNKYRLTTEPWNRRVAVINESGKRQVYKDRLFSI